MVFQLVRLALVLGLVFAAALLATPPGRLPLALRGVAKLLKVQPSEPRPVPPWRRALAFVLVLMATALALI